MYIKIYFFCMQLENIRRESLCVISENKIEEKMKKQEKHKAGCNRIFAVCVNKEKSHESSSNRYDRNRRELK